MPPGKTAHTGNGAHRKMAHTGNGAHRKMAHTGKWHTWVRGQCACTRNLKEGHEVFRRRKLMCKEVKEVRETQWYPGREKHAHYEGAARRSVYLEQRELGGDYEVRVERHQGGSPKNSSTLELTSDSL